MFPVVCVEAPRTAATTGEIDSGWLSADCDCHGIGERLAPEKTCPAGTEGPAGPNPVPHRMITSPGLAGAATVT